jgi:hypothetical protein
VYEMCLKLYKFEKKGLFIKLFYIQYIMKYIEVQKRMLIIQQNERIKWITTALM